MNRRNFLANSVLAAGASALAVSAQTGEQPTRITVRTDQPLGALAPERIQKASDTNPAYHHGLPGHGHNSSRNAIPT